MKATGLGSCCIHVWSNFNAFYSVSVKIFKSNKHLATSLAQRQASELGNCVTHGHNQPSSWFSYSLWSTLKYMIMLCYSHWILYFNSCSIAAWECFRMIILFLIVFLSITRRCSFFTVFRKYISSYSLGFFTIQAFFLPNILISSFLLNH